MNHHPWVGSVVAGRCLVGSKRNPVAIQLTVVLRIAKARKGLAGVFVDGDESRTDNARPLYLMVFCSQDGLRVRFMETQDSHNGLEVLLQQAIQRYTRPFEGRLASRVSESAPRRVQNDCP